MLDEVRVGPGTTAEELEDELDVRVEAGGGAELDEGF